MYRTHSLLVYILILTLVAQGFFINNKIFGFPVWSIVLLLFIPFLNRYSSLVLNLKNKSLRQVYYYFLILITFLIMVNLYTLSVKRIGTLLVGVFISTILFYEYRNRATVFVKFIIAIIVLESVFSIIQFHFDIEFFQDFKRQAIVFENGAMYKKIWDTGSSGTFGFPVPYGYFMGTFFPIVYPFVFSFFRRRNTLRNMYIVLLSLVSFYGLFLSMQRAAIITSIASIIVINMFIIKRKINLIILLMMVSLTIVFFGFLDMGREVLSWDIITKRLGSLYDWIMQSIANQESSPHMYIYNLFSYYSFFGVIFILIFYTILLRILIKHKKYRRTVLPPGAFAGLILSIISYGIISLFHNNGHFAYDIVGFISIGYIFAIIYFVSENHHHASCSNTHTN